MSWWVEIVRNSLCSRYFKRHASRLSLPCCRWFLVGLGGTPSSAPRCWQCYAKPAPLSLLHQSIRCHSRRCSRDSGSSEENIREKSFLRFFFHTSNPFRTFWVKLINVIRSSLEQHTYHTPLAVFLAAEHGLFPLQRSESGVQVLDQLVSVLQLDQLEGLLRPNAHYDGVGKEAGAFCFLYGQHLTTKWRKQGIKMQSTVPYMKWEWESRLVFTACVGIGRREAERSVLKYIIITSFKVHNQ